MSHITKHTSNQIEKNSSLMGLATLITRITGFARTWAMAYVLGTSITASSYQIANNLPNMIYELVAGGVIASAFIPVLMSVKTSSQNENKYASNVINISFIFLGIISILACIFAPQIVWTQMFTVSAESQEFQEAVFMFRFFSIQIVFYALSALITSLLNTKRSFFLSAIVPTFVNLLIIVGLYIYSIVNTNNHYTAMMILAILTSAGVILQCILQIPALIKTGFKWHFIINLKDEYIKELVKLALPSLLFVITSVLAVSARNAFAIKADIGGPAILSYAWLLFQLPYGIFAVSISQTVFIELSESFSSSLHNIHIQYIKKGILDSLRLIVPYAVLMFVLSDTIAGIFQAGNFDEQDMLNVSKNLKIWSIALPAYTLYMFIYRVYNSQKRILLFSMIHIITVVIQISGYYLLSESLGLIGIPITDIAAYSIGSIITVFGLKQYITHCFDKTTIVSLIKIIAIGIIIYFVFNIVALMLPAPTSAVYAIIECLFIGILFICITFLSFKMLKIKPCEIL